MVQQARTWTSLLADLLAARDLSAEDTAWAMDRLMQGEATPVQVAALAVALRAKGETAVEISGFVRAMLAHAVRVPLPEGAVAVDTCGTGGDRAATVNISTMAALVVAAAGVTVIKHGGRAASSASGSADLLEALGVVVDLAPEGVLRCVRETGIGFCFAPRYHPAMRHAAAARSELGVPTVFNILGPLTNPAQPPAQAVGVSDARLAPVMAQVLADRGISALVFRGDDGLDELTTATTSRVWVVAGGVVSEETVDPRALGLAPSAPGALAGGVPSHNAEVTHRFLAGERGPVRDAVLLNAAAALVATEPGSGPVSTRLGPAIERAAAAVDSGGAAGVLERWIAASRDAA